MYKNFLRAFGLGTVFLLSSSLFAVTAIYEVAPTPVYTHPHKIGINLGTWATYGAQQFSANILMNPGFEGDIDRIFVFVDSVNGNTFFDQAGWGYDDGYWDGASYQVMTGDFSGITGTIVSSVYQNVNNGLPAYTTTSSLPPLGALDAIVLTKETHTDPVPIWWIPFPAQITVDSTTKRPNSPGIQSLKMTPNEETPAQINFYLDAESDHADKFLLVNGRWKFSIWAKSDASSPTLEVLFRRINGTTPFLLTTFTLSSQWKEYQIEFDAEDEGIAQTLQLQLIGAGSGGNIWMDDVFLGSKQSNPTYPFREEVVTLLSELNPSFIRDLQGQLGDSFANRIAPLWGRKPASSRFYNAPRALSSLYSIGDLLKLCKTVKANPWIIIPAVFTEEEAYNLGRYLSLNAPSHVFSEVMVEFGNENWNYQFRSSGIPYADVHGIIAERTFKQMMAGAGWNVNLVKVVNGQYVNPFTTMEFLNSTPSADGVAVAPYIFPRLNTDSSILDNLTEMFAPDIYMQYTAILVKATNKHLYVSETNLTTQDGNAPASLRDQYTVGAAAGAALAMRLIDNMKLKVDPQCIYSFSQYDFYTSATNEFIKLWGITRDLSPTLRLRPQGIAMAMLNKVIGDTVYEVTPINGEPTDNLSIVAFRHLLNWDFAATNPNPDPVTVRIAFPLDTRALPLKLHTLHYASSPLDTNEDEENVTIRTSTIQPLARTITFTIPARGFVTGGGLLPLPRS